MQHPQTTFRPHGLTFESSRIPRVCGNFYFFFGGGTNLYNKVCFARLFYRGTNQCGVRFTHDCLFLGTNLRSKEVILTHFQCGVRFSHGLWRDAFFVSSARPFPKMLFRVGSLRDYVRVSRHIRKPLPRFADGGFAPAFCPLYLRPYASISVDICAKKVAKFLQISENIPSKLAYVRFL